MNTENIPTLSSFNALIAALLSVLPLILLINAKSLDVYGPLLSRLSWQRWWNTRRPRAAPGFAVLLGILGGALAALGAVYLGGALLTEIAPLQKPRSRLTWTIQVAFLVAGFVEEFFKCTIALALAFVFCRIKPEIGSRKPGKLFLPSVPFLAGAVGIGFALLENQKYFATAPVYEMPSLFFSRALVSAPVHAAINFHFGLSLLEARRDNIKIVALYSLVFCIHTHGIFDFFALSSEAFPRFIATTIMILMCVIALKRMYSALPETSHRFQASPIPLPPRKDRDVPPGYVYAFTRDPHRFYFPPVAERFAEETLFSDATKALPPELTERLLREEHRGLSPPSLEEERKSEEEELREEFPRGRLHVWDVSVFADRPGEWNRLLKEQGLDLRAFPPLRVLEIAPLSASDPDESGGKPGKNARPEPEVRRWIYQSSGLREAYGREIRLSFPRPARPGARLFFLRLAQGRVDSPLKTFQTVFLPEPWTKERLPAFLTLPIPRIAPIRARRAKRPRPLEALLLTAREAEIIRKNDATFFLNELKRAGLPWANLPEKA